MKKVASKTKNTKPYVVMGMVLAFGLVYWVAITLRTQNDLAMITPQVVEHSMPPALLDQVGYFHNKYGRWPKDQAEFERYLSKIHAGYDKAAYQRFDFEQQKDGSLKLTASGEQKGKTWKTILLLSDKPDPNSGKK